MPTLANCRYAMVQLTITDPERLEKAKVDTGGRISIGKEHAGESVEYAIVRISKTAKGEESE